MTQGTLSVVPLGDIKENIVALRAVDKSKDGFKELVDSVRERGIINPISVMPDAKEPGKFVLVDGLHRFSAAVDAGLTEIPVHVLEISERDVLEIQIEANLQKIETKPVQYTRQLQRIMARYPERTLAEQAKRLHKSPQWLKERLAFGKLSDPVAGLVDEGMIVVSNAYILTRFPEEEQEAWIERATTLPPDQFVPMALSRAKELRRESKGETVKSTGPVARLRKLGDIKSEYARSKDLGDSVDTEIEKSYVDGYAAALAWILQVDPGSVRLWEDEQAKLEAIRLEKKEERAAKKAAEGIDGESPTLESLMDPGPEKAPKSA